MTTIELFNRDLFAVKDLLFSQLNNLLIPGQLYSAYAKKYAVTTKKGAAGNELSGLPVMHDINAAPDNSMDFSYYGTHNTFSAEWKFNPIQPYNIIVDSYFKERYVPAWWEWTFDDEDFMPI